MKKILLSLLPILIGTTLLAQVSTFTFNGNKTGLETSGENQTNNVAPNADWVWSQYNAKCDGSSGGAAGGGYDFTTVAYFAHGYGFGGDPGAKYLMNLNASGTASDQYYLDLSSPSNQKLKFGGSLTETNGSPNYADVPNVNFSQTIIVELYGKSYNIVATKTITMTNASTNYVIDFSDAIADQSSMDSIRQISFAHTNCETVKHSNTYRLYASNIQVGSFATTGITGQSSILLSSSLYPNPTENKVTFDMELKEPSEVQIQLIDVTGNTVQNLVGVTASSIHETVLLNAELNGIYAVRYLINGVIAKSELISIQ